MIKFTKIEVTGLFGESDVCIPITDNRVILVGYNGIGKSTILNIFYFFISQQWHKLCDQEFFSVSLSLEIETPGFSAEGRDPAVEEKKIEILRTQLLEYMEGQHERGLEQSFGPQRTQIMLRKTRELLTNRAKELVNNERIFRHSSSYIADIEYIQLRLKVSRFHAIELVRNIQRTSQPEFVFIETQNVRQIEKFLFENLGGRILYLPTYRRIEKDIKTVFPEFEEEFQRKIVARRHNYLETDIFIELVQFGMDDVKENLTNRLEKIKAYALYTINGLTITYLRDVIRDEAKLYEGIAPSQISEDAIDLVFSKVGSEILNKEDKNKIKKVVGKIDRGDELSENEKYVAHYVDYLIDVGKKIFEKERHVTRFIDTCNSYLFGKSFVFDNVLYKVSVIHESGRPVEMEELSSGEKQVVSLFSHLLLEPNVLNYIVIDEPELSLSVEWQQRLLTDISELSNCSLICAATHSPFIFQNRLKESVIDLLEHTKKPPQ